MSKKIYIIDGKNFNNFEGFTQEFSEQVLKNYRWRGNPDAFNDILSGGFGTPDEGFILIWKNSEISRQKLSFDETINWSKERILQSHPTNVEYFEKRIEQLKRGNGKTLFDEIVEIINLEEHSDIELRLE